MTKLRVSFTMIGNTIALLSTVHSLAKYQKRKIDAIRMDIERRFQSSEIDQDFYILLLATL